MEICEVLPKIAGQPASLYDMLFGICGHGGMVDALVLGTST